MLECWSYCQNPTRSKDVTSLTYPRPSSITTFISRGSSNQSSDLSQRHREGGLNDLYVWNVWMCVWVYVCVRVDLHTECKLLGRLAVSHEELCSDWLLADNHISQRWHHGLNAKLQEVKQIWLWKLALLQKYISLQLTFNNFNSEQRDFISLIWLKTRLWKLPPWQNTYIISINNYIISTLNNRDRKSLAK